MEPGKGGQAGQARESLACVTCLIACMHGPPARAGEQLSREDDNTFPEGRGGGVARNYCLEEGVMLGVVPWFGPTCSIAMFM